MLNKKMPFWNTLYKAGVHDVEKMIGELYESGMSCGEIREFVANKYNAYCSSRNILDYVKRSGVAIRDKKASKINAIKRGRMIYYKKPEHEKYKSKVLSIKIRLEVLTRDKFQCVLCGNSPKTGHSLEIHHLKPESNKIDDLRTLCFLCHRGLHAK
jgi:5-methylcytosine-specific restriction endonuclease McrA